MHRIEICAILVYFCLNFVAMATSTAPLKIYMAYLKSPTHKQSINYFKLYHIRQNCVDILYRKEVMPI